jgi:hypothetical protein
MQETHFSIVWPLYSPAGSKGVGTHVSFPYPDGNVGIAFFTDLDLLHRFQKDNPFSVQWYELAGHTELHNFLEEVVLDIPKVQWYVLDPAPPQLFFRKIDGLREWAAHFAKKS